VSRELHLVPQNYEVVEGDCIASLSYVRGLFWRTVWDHPLNAALKARRRDPNILKPHDIVHLPDKQLKTVDKPTDQQHLFMRKGVPAKLRLKILEDDQPEMPPHVQTEPSVSRQFFGEDPDTSGASERQRPRAGVPYVLVIDGKSTEGETDSEGMLEISIPPNALGGRLTLEPGTLRETVFNLNLGWLDPIDGPSGMKQRLSNFGFDCGDQTNEATPGFQQAMRAFQESRGLNVTGVADGASLEKLKQEHGG
jgi:Putative peptidoglycan binding domain